MGPTINEWEKVMMFRCVQDPMIGPTSKNAFMVRDLPDWEAWLHTSSGLVYVKTNTGRRHVVGAGNLQGIELYKQEPNDGTTQDISGKRRKTSEKETRGTEQ